MTGETDYCFHSLSGDVDYGICQLTLMTATLQVVERDEICVSPKTCTDFPQQGSYMPEFWAVDRAGNISPVNDSNSFTIFCAVISCARGQGAVHRPPPKGD
jgi:hypothetical protein